MAARGSKLLDFEWSLLLIAQRQRYGWESKRVTISKSLMLKIRQAPSFRSCGGIVPASFGASAVLVVLCLALPVGALTIDDFFINHSPLTSPGSSTQDSPTSNVLGGERDVQLIETGGDPTITAEVVGGAMAFSSDAGGTGLLRLIYDGDDSDATTLDHIGLGGVNLTTGGDNALLLGVNSADAATSVTIDLFSSAIDSSTVTVVIPAGSLPNLIRIPYSTFAGTANFASVGAIQLTFPVAASANAVRLDFLRTGSATAPAPVEALLTDIVLVDNDSNGKASAGDTLRYVVTIKNNSAGTLTGVQFNAPAVANASAAANITATPVARDEGVSGSSVPGSAFHTPFNTALTVIDGDSDEDLLNNDFLGAPAATITKFGGGTLGGTVDDHNAGATANSGGHALTVNGNGSFTYTPANGFTGLFTFQYRLANSGGSDTATVTLAVGTRPGADTDSYNVTGNTPIDTTLIPESVLTGDTGDAISISGNTSPANGSLSFNTATGHFTYTPNVGYTGADSFTYTLGNGFGNVVGTVNLTVANRVWYIDVTAAAGGDGRSHLPYNTIGAFNAVNSGALPNPQDGDIIILRDGGYTEGLTLRNGQRLIGDGWSGTFAAAAGFSLAPGNNVAAFSNVKPRHCQHHGGRARHQSGHGQSCVRRHRGQHAQRLRLPRHQRGQPRHQRKLQERPGRWTGPHARQRFSERTVGHPHCQQFYCAGCQSCQSRRHVDGRLRQHHRTDWNSGQRERRQREHHD